MLGDAIQQTKMEAYEFELRRRAYSGLSRRLKHYRDEHTIAELVKTTNLGNLENALKDTSPDDLHKFTIQTYTQYKKDFIEKNQTVFPGMDDRFSLGHYIDRLEYELKVIKEMGFNSYFLIVSEYVRRAKEHQISVGPGRGSGAGSLLARVVGITEIDPLPFDLLFERFLNPARVSMPDFDIDFEDSLRQEVIDHCYELYGSEKVCSIGTFMKMATKAAFKDTARALGLPFEKSNYITNMLQDKTGLIAQVEDPECPPELRSMYESDDKVHQALEYGDSLTGNVRQMGVHACGIIIAPEKVTTYTPTQYNKEEDHTIVSQYDGPTLESIGLLKMDFLGLRNLSIIKNCVKIIKARAEKRGEKIPDMFEEFLETMSLNIPIDDEETYKSVFQQGDTTGIFQFESAGMRRYLVELIPERIDNLVAMNALYRPGPMEFIPSYIARKLGKEEIEYMYPDLRAELTRKYGAEVAEEERKKLIEDLSPIMKDTYGIAVYQEQLMFLVQAMAGFSLGEADMLRRGVGKKKKAVIEQLKKEFVERGASFRGYKPETTTQIYEKMIEPAASYSFNKSHSVCYAMIAYQTAYLKVHYPVEFSAALIRSVEEDVDTQSFYISEIQNHGISVLQPDVNASFNHVAAIDDSVRIGFISIKGVGFDTGEYIQEERKNNGNFTSIENFAKRCAKVLNRKSLEGLIKSGALDQFEDRKVLWENVNSIIDWIANSSNASQGLFGELENKIPLKKVEKCTLMDRLMMEQDVFKIFISGNPLDGLYKFIKKKTLLSNVKYKDNFGAFEIVGYVKDIRRAKKKGFFITIEDISDSVDFFRKETYGFEVFDMLIVHGWKKNNRMQISKITKTTRQKLKSMAGGLYDGNDTVALVKKARSGEQQQEIVERLKSEIENKKSDFMQSMQLDVNVKSIDLEMEDILQNSDGISKVDDIGLTIHNDEDRRESLGCFVESAVGDEIDHKNIKTENNTKEKSESQLQERVVLYEKDIPFDKLKGLINVISRNPGEQSIEILGKEVKISEQGIQEIHQYLNQ